MSYLAINLIHYEGNIQARYKYLLITINHKRLRVESLYQGHAMTALGITTMDHKWQKMEWPIS